VAGVFVVALGLLVLGARSADWRLRLVVGDKMDDRVLLGFHAVEQNEAVRYRWSWPEAGIRLYGLDGRPAVLALRLAAPRPSGTPLPALALQTRTRPLCTFAVASTWRQYHLLTPTQRTSVTALLVRSSAFIPGDGDPRELGVALSTFDAWPVGMTGLLPMPQRALFLLALPLLGWLFVWRMVHRQFLALSVGVGLAGVVGWAAANPMLSGYLLPTIEWPGWELVPLLVLFAVPVVLRWLRPRAPFVLGSGLVLALAALVALWLRMGRIALEWAVAMGGTLLALTGIVEVVRGGEEHAYYSTIPASLNRLCATWLRRWSLLWEHPVSCGILSLCVYGVLAAQSGRWWELSVYPFYNYLADAFLHGQLHLRFLPGSTRDLSYFNGRYYLYWSPFPAVLLMPFVALFGVTFSDKLFTLGIGAVNVALVALLLRHACARRVIRLRRIQRGLLTLFFALGTVHLTLAPYGRVWFTGQLIGFGCVALAYLAALSLNRATAFALTGLALAAAFLTRNHLLLAGLWPASYLVYQHRHTGWRRLLAYVGIGLLPVVCALALHAIYNWLRFGSPFDNGIAYHAMADVFRADYARYGAFDRHYVPINLFYQYVVYPFPWMERSYMGGSLLLLSPVFVAAVGGVAIGRPRWSAWSLLGSILLVATPILLLMGTGWAQFGPRYTLDYTVPLLLLTALGLRGWPAWYLVLLTVLSILQYLGGLLVFRPF
jgi:hypothetical protein